MELAEFNSLDHDQAEQVLRPCVGIDRWISQIIQGRPYASIEQLIQAGRDSANPFTEAELDGALAQHPRIGERAAGQSKEAKLSRGEQATLNLTDEVNLRLTDANRAYEARFSRVFLIRAAGRSAAEVLAECQRRLENDPTSELREVSEELRAIALLRLSQMVTEPLTECH